MDTIIYPYDPTGEASTNKVTSVVTLPRVRNRAFAPEGGPFYKDSVVLVDLDTGNEIPKTSYDCLFLYSEATELTAKTVNAIINVHDKDYHGTIEVTTQVVGHPYGSNVSAIQRMLAVLEIDNRTIKFDDLIDVPVTMPPSPHLTWVGDLYGAESIVNALEQISTTNNEASLAMAELINNRYNRVYELLEELSDGSDGTNGNVNALRKDVDDNYSEFVQVTTDLRKVIEDNEKDIEEKNAELKSIIDGYSGTISNLSERVNSLNDNVESFSGTIDQLGQSLRELDAAVEGLRDLFDDHVKDVANPHRVTKTQVGLGNVSNFPNATISEARAGTGSRFIQASILKQYMDERITTVDNSLNTHTKDDENPHKVTKTQLGLGNVNNYPTASTSQMNSGTAGVYTTANVVKAYVDSKIGGSDDALGDHVGKTDNPHGVTKTQIGLSNLSNYRFATISEMRAGTTSRYAANNVVKAYIDERISAIPTATKTSVGLGNVSNYSTASLSESLSGSSNSRFMTPYGVKKYVDSVLSSSTDSSWEVDAVDNGRFGYIRHNESGLTLQWGQTPAMEESRGVVCYYRKAFTGSPFAVTEGNLTWTGDSSSNDAGEIAEIRGTIVAKSITNQRFYVVTKKISGSNTDGVVVSWLAVGITPNNTTVVSENARCAYISSSTWNVYVNGPPTRGANHIVAPTTTSGGGTTTPGGGNGCLLPDVTVTMEDGTRKAVRDIILGDKLRTRAYKGMPQGEDSNWRDYTLPLGTESEVTTVTVTGIRLSSFADHFVINKTLKITEQHEIWAGRDGKWRWMDARDILVNDVLLNESGREIPITTIKHVIGNSPVYDIDVEEVDTYFAGGFLVHNAETKSFE